MKKNIDIEKIYKDFFIKIPNTIKLDDACKILNIKNIWKTDKFNGEIGIQLFYKFIKKSIK